MGYDFEQFEKALGENAKRYTADELRQLHAEVLCLARVLLAIRRKSSKRLRPVSSPQVLLDSRPKAVHQWKDNHAAVEPAGSTAASEP